MRNEISKGAVIMVAGWWFIVVKAIITKDKSINFYCICDNANNIYSHSIKEIDFFATPFQAVKAHSWDIGDQALLNLKAKREIPLDVIGEVLAGAHDDRFDHWVEK